VATLGYSRRLNVRGFRHERQSAWFEGLEGAFRHFDGVRHEVLIDNAPSLSRCRYRVRNLRLVVAPGAAISARCGMIVFVRSGFVL
jgi:hypothetical protein